jgi:hypothetical protein
VAVVTVVGSHLSASRPLPYFPLQTHASIVPPDPWPHPPLPRRYRPRVANRVPSPPLLPPRGVVRLDPPPPIFSLSSSAKSSFNDHHGPFRRYSPPHHLRPHQEHRKLHHLHPSRLSSPDSWSVAAITRFTWDHHRHLPPQRAPPPV